MPARKRNAKRSTATIFRRCCFMVAAAYLPAQILLLIRVHHRFSSTALSNEHKNNTLSMMESFWLSSPPLTVPFLAFETTSTSATTSSSNQSPNAALMVGVDRQTTAELPQKPSRLENGGIRCRHRYQQKQRITTNSIRRRKAQLLSSSSSSKLAAAMAATTRINEQEKEGEKDDWTASFSSSSDSAILDKNVSTVPPSSPFAYAFVLGGIDPDRPAYKGFLYNILVATRLLRKMGSTADVWIWTQLSPATNNATSTRTLPSEDVRLLKALHIHIQELTTPSHESFAQIVYSKFRVLQMTQYERVMFLDADIMPLVNLDYLFHLSLGGDDFISSRPLLRPNLILATREEPCNTGLFIVQPLVGDWERLQTVVQAQHQSGQKLLYPHFDWQTGWGYDFEKNRDHWEAIQTNGTQWKFHAGHSDQGLMYYWAKFVKQDVTIVIKNRLQHWVPGDDNRPRLVSEISGALELLPPAKRPRDRPLFAPPFCGKQLRPEDDKTDFQCLAPYRDFKHFSGSSKPWQKSLFQIQHHSSFGIWFGQLQELNQELKINLDLKNWNKKYLPVMKASPLGYMALWTDQASVVNGSQ